VGAAAIGMDGDWQANKYQVKPLPPNFDPMTDTLDDAAYRSLPTYFLALEDSDACNRMLCGAARAFTMHVKDASGAEVLRFKRPYNCTFPCGLPFCFTYINPQQMARALPLLAPTACTPATPAPAAHALRACESALLRSRCAFSIYPRRRL
jgi:hypothetical protein